MKLLFFDDFKLGVLKGDAVVDVSDTVKDIPHTGPHNLISGLIERFGDYKRRLEGAVAKGQGKGDHPSIERPTVATGGWHTRRPRSATSSATSPISKSRAIE